MNPHMNACPARTGFACDRGCYAEPLADWEIELLSGAKPNPHGKIHDRIAVLGRERDAGLRMIGSLTVDGKDTAAAIAGVKVINAQITELRNVLGWL